MTVFGTMRQLCSLKAAVIIMDYYSAGTTEPTCNNSQPTWSPIYFNITQTTQYSILVFYILYTYISNVIHIVLLW